MSPQGGALAVSSLERRRVGFAAVVVAVAMSAVFLVGGSPAVGVVSATASVNLTTPVPFLAEGQSATVGGVTVSATTSSALVGDTYNTYLYRNDGRISTTFTFSPPVPAISLVTRNHADAPENGFERFVFVGRDADGEVVMQSSVVDTNGSFEFVLDGVAVAGQSTLSAQMASLEVQWDSDAGAAPMMRGSYLEVFLNSDVPQLSPVFQVVSSWANTPLSPMALSASGFGGSVTFTLESGSLPPGVTLDPATGAFIGNPTSDWAGTAVIRATGQHWGTVSAIVDFDTGTCLVPFLAQGESATVGGVTVNAAASSAVVGDTTDSFLYVNDDRIATTFTFSPPAPAIKLVTRNHADSPKPGGFEEFEFVGRDAQGAEVVRLSVVDTDGLFEFGHDGAPLTSLEVAFEWDQNQWNPPPPNARGSYLELRLNCPRPASSMAVLPSGLGPLVSAPTQTTAPTTTTVPTVPTTMPTVPTTMPSAIAGFPVVPAGEARVTRNGQPVAVTVSVRDGRFVVEGADFELAMWGACAGDADCPIVDNAQGRQVLTFDQQGSIGVNGTGLAPGSSVDVWLFSEPTSLGSTVVGPDGSFTYTVVYSGVPAGDHTLQVNGVAADGSNLAANVGVSVAESSRGSLPTTGRSPQWLVPLLVLAAGLASTGIARRGRGVPKGVV